MAFTDNFKPYKLPIFKNGVRLPEIKITEEQLAAVGLKPGATNSEYLKKLTWNACLEKIKSGKIKQSKKECSDRFKFEFEVFEKTGTIDYILLLMDIFLWCDKNNIARGVGRGSAAGSLALMALNLTNVNPLDHDLNFTRFLNEARAKTHMVDGIMHVDGKSFADFDGDVSFSRRPDIIRRIEKDYAGKTCKILTMQYLTGKMALKDTVKSYLNYNESQALELGDCVESLFGKVDSLDKTYEKSKKFKEWADKHQKAFKIAQKIEGLFRTTGQHASGVLVSYYNLEDIIPMQAAATGEIVSGYDMDVCLTISLKADLLGLRTTDILQIASELSGIRYVDIDIHDPAIYKFLATNDKFYGLFQIEDGLTKEVVTKVKPKNIDQLAACLSISRPGALKFIDDYVKFVQTGERKPIYPAIDTILEPTGGLILYQEQINNICQNVYKMSGVDADEVRRAIGKKLREDMAKWEPVLYAKGKEHGIPEAVTKYFWDTCNSSADYLFNANHCYSYSYITAYTVYLKTKYPSAFYLACLKMAQYEQNPIDCISRIQSELEHFNIKLLMPDILKSQEDYVMEDVNIRMGLSGIKGLSDAALAKLKDFRTVVTNKFDLFLSLQNSGIPVNILSALVLSGCFDSIRGTTTRNKLLMEYEVFNEFTDRELKFVVPLGPKYNYEVGAIITACVEQLKDEKGKPFIKESRRDTLRKKCAPYIEKYRRNSKFEELTA
jgi:DNA polymerase III subunit alpha